MKRFDKKDYLKLELGTQLRRLSYAWATTRGLTHCPFPPRKIAIEASSFCNLRCIHCAHGDSPEGGQRMTRPKSNMSLELFKKIADEAATFRHATKLVFAMMGEPLMNKRLVEMISYAHQKGLWTQVNTNAMLLDRQKAEDLIDAGLDFMYLSLDGITKETYERIRVRGKFDQVMANILDFIQLKYEKGAFGLTVHVGMTAEIINREEIELFIREFQKLPIDAAYSPLLFNWNGAIEWANNELDNLQTPDRSKWPVCNSSYDIIGIQSDGGVIPCMYDYDGKYVSGNVGEKPLLEIWNNKKTRIFRHAVNTKQYELIEDKGPCAANAPCFGIPTIRWTQACPRHWAKFAITLKRLGAITKIRRLTSGGNGNAMNTCAEIVGNSWRALATRKNHPTHITSTWSSHREFWR